MSLTDGKYTINLLDSAFNLVEWKGKAQNGINYSDDFTGMMELIWDNGNLAILTEGRAFEDGTNYDVLRVTSYNTGAFIDLKPKDTKVNLSFRISVGMSSAEFERVLNPAGGVNRMLVKAGALEEWLYYPGLNMGVLIKDKKVVGVTVTPSDD
jgi:hypothetical protein